MKKNELPELPSGFIHMVSDHMFSIHGGGHHLTFTPGVPLPVHRSIQSKALAHGAKPVNGEAVYDENDRPDPRVDPTSESYRAAVRTAAEKILSSNISADFGANGKPYVHSWERELGWRPLLSVRDKIWEEVKNAHTRKVRGQ
jgi:hypothetical protein